MELGEVIKEILLKKFSGVPETQRPRALAQLLHIGEMDARRLMAAGRNQRKQFEIFIQLLPVCKELNIDLARPLQSSVVDRGAQPYTGKNDDADRKLSKEAVRVFKEDVAKKQGKIENAAHGLIPTGKSKKSAKR